MKNELKIYQKVNGKKELVNTIEITDVNRELAKIYIAKEIRGVKTKTNKIPYSDWVKITETWERETYSLSYTTIYEYTLNIENI